MTMIATTCITYAVLRCLEEFVRFCINFISRLTTRKKEDKASVQEWKRISAYVAPDFHEALKNVTQKMGYTISDYILVSIDRQICRDIEREKKERGL